MIFRLTAPNWERPSPYYGSHIIMSISGIYLPISIHTLYHSLVLSLTQVHEITYFHHTLCLLKYTSASFSSLAPTDDSRWTLSIYIIFFYLDHMPVGIFSVTSLPADNCTQRLRTGTSPTCPISSADYSRTTSSDKKHNIHGQVQSRPGYTPIHVNTSIATYVPNSLFLNTRNIERYVLYVDPHIKTILHERCELNMLLYNVRICKSGT